MCWLRLGFSHWVFLIMCNWVDECTFIERGSLFTE